MSKSLPICNSCAVNQNMSFLVSNCSYLLSIDTTARMESSGKPGFVHVSKETADLLTQSGKKHWLTMREEKIVAKGKGELQTYWLKKRLKHSDTQSIGSVESSSIADSASGGTDNSVQAKHDERTERLVSTRKIIVSWFASSSCSLILHPLATADHLEHRNSFESSEASCGSQKCQEKGRQNEKLSQHDFGGQQNSWWRCLELSFRGAGNHCLTRL